MFVKDFITKDIPILKRLDTVEYALALMEDWKLKQLPFIKDNSYKGLISEKELLEFAQPSDTISQPTVFSPYIAENNTIYAALTLMARYGLSILPVINSDGFYIGAITKDNLIEAMASLCSTQTPGSLIILEMPPQDYQLSDIARIVESNNAHIQNLLSHTDTKNGRLYITIKIDLEDASPVIRSFERFNYTITYHFMEQGIIDEVLQQRMDELLHYMNM